MSCFIPTSQTNVAFPFAVLLRSGVQNDDVNIAPETADREYNILVTIHASVCTALPCRDKCVWRVRALNVWEYYHWRRFFSPPLFSNRENFSVRIKRERERKKRKSAKRRVFISFRMISKQFWTVYDYVNYSYIAANTAVPRCMCALLTKRSPVK